MGKIFRLSLLLTLVLGLVVPALAEEETQEGAGAAFDLSGYYRVRYDNTFNTGWRFNEEFTDGEENQDSDWWSYFDQRALLLSTVQVNEKIALKAQVDALRNVMFGQNAKATVPVARVTRNPADTEEIENVEFDAERLNRGNIFSQNTSANASFYANDGEPGDEVDTIELSRLWAEVMLPFGFLRFGRMPSNFGMGVFSNDGLPEKTAFGWKDLDGNYGDTYDRLMFGTKIGPYIPILLYDRVVEDDFKTGDNDVHQYAFVQYIRGISLGKNSDFNGGLYLMHRRQRSTDARVFVYDLYLKLKFGGFVIENEALALQGSCKQIGNETIEDLEESGLPTGAGGGKIEINAYIDAFRMQYRTLKWGAGTDFGFSSPADPDPEREFDSAAAARVAVAAAQKDADEDASKNSIDFINAVVENQAAFGNRVFTFPFDKDFDVDLIIWEVLMGGAVKNGLYAKVGGYIQPVQEFRIQADVIKSWINESHKGTDGKDAGHDLGWEVDLDFSGTFYDHFYTGVQFGYAWVGDYFHDVYDDAKNIFTMQMRAGVTF